VSSLFLEPCAFAAAFSRGIAIRLMRLTVEGTGASRMTGLKIVKPGLVDRDKTT